MQVTIIDQGHLPFWKSPGDNNKYAIKKKEPPPKMNNKEPIELAKFPDGQKHENEVKPAPIEREDWPAPPAAAAAFPEIRRFYAVMVSGFLTLFLVVEWRLTLRCQN